MTDKLERLAAARIQLLPAFEIANHYVFERDGFVALVEKTPAGFGAIGAPGLLFERGFAALVWRGSEGWFVAKGFEQRASSEQVDALRQFAQDLESALR